MPGIKGSGDRELLEKLTQAIEEWESSPYYLQDEELFDLERFLEEHQATQVKEELEGLYGTPLNQKFWTSFLAYHRLKKARGQIKAQDSQQEEKRKRYMEAVEEEKKAWQQWMKEWFRMQRREQLRVLPGGKSDTANPTRKGEE